VPDSNSDMDSYTPNQMAAKKKKNQN